MREPPQLKMRLLSDEAYFIMKITGDYDMFIS